MAESLDIQVRQTLRYVPFVARRYLVRGVDLQELIAAGNLGLVQAALRFDHRRDVKFLTYADWWIRKAIVEAREESSGAVRYPRYQHERLAVLRRARADWISRHGSAPVPEQLARDTGLSLAAVEMLLRIPNHWVSLDQSHSPGDPRPIGESLPTPDADSPQETLVRQDLAKRLHTELDVLQAREREVIVLRFGLDGGVPRTLRQAGRVLGISRERVRQIEIRTLLMLRERFAAV